MAPRSPDTLTRQQLRLLKLRLNERPVTMHNLPFAMNPRVDLRGVPMGHNLFRLPVDLPVVDDLKRQHPDVTESLHSGSHNLVVHIFKGHWRVLHPRYSCLHTLQTVNAFFRKRVEITDARVVERQVPFRIHLDPAIQRRTLQADKLLKQRTIPSLCSFLKLCNAWRSKT